MAKSKKLAETHYLSGAKTGHKIDRDAGIIRGVRVIGFESVNRRRYPKAVLEAAAKKYEGADVNLDQSGMQSRIILGWGRIFMHVCRRSIFFKPYHHV